MVVGLPTTLVRHRPNNVIQAEAVCMSCHRSRAVCRAGCRGNKAKRGEGERERGEREMLLTSWRNKDALHSAHARCLLSYSQLSHCFYMYTSHVYLPRQNCVNLVSKSRRWCTK